MASSAENRLGAFLKDRRQQLDPVALGYSGGRRRTPGLRREEVAQRALISPTWYTWLEQGRGGAPSAEVLERVARALLLTDVEREHLFLIGLGRPPEPRFEPRDAVSPRLQRVLDALMPCPALVKTLWWDVVAWNGAAAAVLTDYAALPPAERNILRLMFGNTRVRAAQDDWLAVARFVVGAFRADAARAGDDPRVRALIDDLTRQSPEFAALWHASDVNDFGGGLKRLHHPQWGRLTLEYSAFAVDGRPDLAMLVFAPTTPEDAALVQKAIAASQRPSA